MKSKISENQQDDTIKLCRQMKPEERLVAFFNHSRLINEIHRAGAAFRRRSSYTVNRKNSPKKS